ncbi:MAG: hypothetical protein H6921_00150 [Sphingomonas sp.]|nr:hypothetical protein [Sphingomonas sp.]
MSALSIFFGGLMVLTLFIGQVTLLGSLFDRCNARAKAIEDTNPGQANRKAEQLARVLGEMLLRAVHAVAWLAGLLVFPWLCVIVYHGTWIMLPAVFALTLGSSLVTYWTGRNLEALKRSLSPPVSL